MPAIGNNIRLGGVLFVLSFALFAAALFGAAQIVNEKETAEATAGGPVGGGPPATAGQPVNVTIVARNIEFETRTIRAGVGVEVTVTLDNQDAGILHNIAFYETPQAGDEIFVGKLITGVDQVEETFTAPSRPGTYFFRCDVHPDLMTGSFIVD